MGSPFLGRVLRRGRISNSWGEHRVKFDSRLYRLFGFEGDSVAFCHCDVAYCGGFRIVLLKVTL